MGFVWTLEILHNCHGKLLRLDSGHFATLRRESNGVWALYSRRLAPKLDGFVTGGEAEQMLGTLARAGAAPATEPMTFAQAVAGLDTLDATIRFDGTEKPLAPEELLNLPGAPLEAMVQLRFDVEKDRSRHVAGRMVLPSGKALRFGPG